MSLRVYREGDEYSYVYYIVEPKSWDYEILYEDWEVDGYEMEEREFVLYHKFVLYHNSEDTCNQVLLLPSGFLS